jgi:hypothetical protein
MDIAFSDIPHWMLVVVTLFATIVAIVHIYFLHKIANNISVASHEQRRNEVALGLWWHWSKVFNSEIRDTVNAFEKWLETEKNEDSKKRWLSYIADGEKVDRDVFFLVEKKIEIPQSIHKLTKKCQKPEECNKCPENKKCEISLQDLENVRSSLITCLDLMEKIAVAYHYCIGSKEIIEQCFRSSVKIKTKQLNDFILQVRIKAPTAWIKLTDLVFYGDWKDQEVKIPSKQSPIENKHK